VPGRLSDRSSAIPTGRVGRTNVPAVRAPSTGLLIVNADDLGLGPEETDRILECFALGALTSATAMVWMEDSERAARLAREAALPVGLHLNLIEPFNGRDVPAAVAARQLRVVERLSAGDAAAHLYHPGWSRDFELCIADQLARFTQLYGRAPTHFDGHQHMHLALNALLARPLSPVKRCRAPLTRMPAESPAGKRAARAALGRLVRLRFTTTDWCFSIRALEPRLGGDGRDGKLALAGRDSVEIMAHPGWPDELELLRTPEWRARIHRQRLGSFADL
jgi:chitin disaccharide deacetylase